MKALFRALFLAGAALPAAAGQVDVSLPAETAPRGVSAAPAVGAAPAPVSLSVPALSGAPLSAPLAAAAPVAAAAAAAPAVAAAAPAALAPALAAPAALPAAAAAPQSPAAPSALSRSAQPAALAGPEAADESGEAALVDDQGRALFDAAAPAPRTSWWDKVRSFAGGGDRLPAFPGAKGDRVRLDRREWRLEEKLPAAEGVSAWSSNRDWRIELRGPQAAPRGLAEARLLRSLAGSSIPHVKLMAASADGSVLVKERFDSDSATAGLERGFPEWQLKGWPEFAARLIRAGVSADLRPDNLLWRRWGSQWTIVDATSLRAAGPGAVLDAMLAPAMTRAGLEPGGFLAALRGRLGPDSREWAGVLAALGASPRHAAALRALSARDDALPPAPRVSYGPALDRAPYPDAVVKGGEPARVLGYEPLTVKQKTMLHTDDPGKLNTEVFSVEPPGKAKVVVKVARWDIIRHEVALRRVVRRFFGTFFDTPSAFGVERGWESYLVMEHKDGSPRNYGENLTREQRAALGVLVHAFGVGDMNPGNVLFGSGERPVLIDFEQALGRHAPVASRLPDEGIALEMPWLSRETLNRAEDFQPAIRAWRRLLAQPATKAALREDFLAAGYSAAEADSLVSLVERNTADLDWTLQNDVEFVNQFVRSRKS